MFTVVNMKYEKNGDYPCSLYTNFITLFMQAFKHLKHLYCSMLTKTRRHVRRSRSHDDPANCPTSPCLQQHHREVSMDIILSYFHANHHHLYDTVQVPFPFNIWNVLAACNRLFYGQGVVKKVYGYSYRT